jgi:type I restriction enzyme S subunit
MKPYPAYKPSGVEWLGEIPEHWEVLSVKRVAKRIQTGSTPPTAEERYYEDGTVSWFGPASFGADLILSEPVKLIAESGVQDGVARLFESGSTMIVTIGATIGKVGYIESPASCNQQITVVTFAPSRSVAKFAAYQMKRLETVLRGIAPNTTLPILDQVEVGYLPFVVPLLSEQRAIAAYLDRETAKIDALIAKTREQIERLKEYRAALISAAVTGKMDVRGEW